MFPQKIVIYLLILTEAIIAPAIKDACNLAVVSLK
jgi:hypothetical protein